MIITDEMVEAAVAEHDRLRDQGTFHSRVRAALEAVMAVRWPAVAGALLRASDQLSAKDAEIARLRKALKPFAEWHLAHIDYDDPNTELFDSDIVGIDVGDLRRARATLEGLI